jgi:hypothetical protein
MSPNFTTYCRLDKRVPNAAGPVAAGSSTPNKDKTTTTAEGKFAAARQTRWIRTEILDPLARNVLTNPAAAHF